MQKITPCLWFDHKAEEAVDFYVSIFKNSKIGDVTHYDAASAEVSGQPEGSVLTINFELEGQQFMALNGGPIFKFTPAISLIVACETQAEVDELWSKLSAIPEAEQCGWLQDKYGVSWQIIPKVLDELLKDPDPIKASKVMQAMLNMKKIDIEALKAAHNGGSKPD